ncbi:MAG: LacI family transcriptional regulator [Spirochaetaceae bacterium]|nr:MAG: LacI family transcriptional regulator [Spirochaetaceae bacterium]
MANVNDVARLAGVSAMTVSRTFNHPHQVRPLTRERVLRAVAQLEFRPDRRARSLVMGNSDTIAVFVPSVLNPFFGRVMLGVTDTAAPAGFNVFLCYSDAPQHVERQLDAIIGLNVDGAVFFDMNITLQQLQRLQRAGVACVLVDNETDIAATDWLRTDSVAGGELATSHLVELGHRRIAHVHGALQPERVPGGVSFEGQFQRRIWQERFQGYLNIMRQAGLPVNQRLIVEGDGTTEGGVAGGRRAMTALLRETAPPSAVYAANDLMAIGALQACREQRYRVPEDISIIGFDDIEVCSLVDPPLSTVRQKRHELGRQAIELLLDTISRRAPRAGLCIKPELVIRNSTARGADSADSAGGQQ